MKAWEFEHKLTADAVPPELHDDNEADWMAYTEAGRASDKQLFHDWDNKVPGSKAPCDVVIAAVQSMHNRGYDVTEAEKFMEEGLKASEEKDGAAIQVATAKIFHALNEAPKDPASPYWSYNTYRTFADVEKEADFGPAAPYDVFSDDFAKKVTAGWMDSSSAAALEPRSKVIPRNRSANASARSTDISAVRRHTTMISPTRSPISTDSSKKAMTSRLPTLPTSGWS